MIINIINISNLLFKVNVSIQLVVAIVETDPHQTCGCKHLSIIGQGDVNEQIMKSKGATLLTGSQT